MNRSLRRLERWFGSVTLVLALLCGATASAADAEGRRLQWSPNRTPRTQQPADTKATGAASQASADEAAVPPWQRSPMQQMLSATQPESRKDEAVQQASYHQPSRRTGPRVVGHPQYSERIISHPQGEHIVGQPEYVEGPIDGYEPGVAFEHGMSSCNACGGGGCDSCGGCWDEDCQEPCVIVIPCWPFGWLWRESYFFAGTHSFAGPVDQGRNGNFGFNEGVNFAGPLLPFYGIGFQIGARFAHSNLSGDRVLDAVERTSTRDQSFITAGVYHRACGGGLQGGIVYDWLTDNYYQDNSLGQMRGELSWVFPRGHEFGFWGAAGTKDDQELVGVQTGRPELFEPVHQYALFYRRTLPIGGQGRLWGGGTSDSDGIVGADFRVPISNRVDFVGGFNYLSPEEGSGNQGAQQESWGITLNIHWYPGRFRDGNHNTAYRALMDVSDNRYFMIDRIVQ